MLGYLIPPPPLSGKWSCRCTHCAHKSVLESANPAWTRSMHLDAPGQRHRQQPVSVKQDKSSRGSIDTTKRRSDPQGRNVQWQEAKPKASKPTPWPRASPPPNLPHQPVGGPPSAHQVPCQVSPEMGGGLDKGLQRPPPLCANLFPSTQFIL